MPTVEEYNPLAPEVRKNPYPYYSVLRQHAPVHWIEPFGFWVVSRYDDVLNVLKSPELFSSQAIRAVLLGGGVAGSDLLGKDSRFRNADIVISSDPPVHTRLRNLVNRGFTPRRISALEPRIRAIKTINMPSGANRSAALRTALNSGSLCPSMIPCMPV